MAGIKTVMTIRHSLVSNLTQIGIQGVVHASFKEFFEGTPGSHSVIALPLAPIKTLDLTKGLMYVCNRYR
jgi:hypothetical protein